MKHRIWLSAAMAVSLIWHGASLAGTSEEKELSDARAALESFVNIPENAIPPALLTQAYGIAVIPSVLKVSFIVGGRRGSGVVAVRNENGKWSNPAFINLTGGSVGWQVGASSTDIILVFKSRKSIDRIARGDVTLGADASVAAGPVGRSVGAATNIRFDAEVYSYSRSRGLFAGVSLEGAAISVDDAANMDFYSQADISPYEILKRTDTSGIPEEGQHFVTTLERYLPRPSEVPATEPASQAEFETAGEGPAPQSGANANMNDRSSGAPASQQPQYSEEEYINDPEPLEYRPLNDG